MNIKRTTLIVAILFTFLSINNAFSKDSIIIAGEYFPPFAFEENGEPTGIDVEVAKQVFDRLGVKYEVKILPWARCWALAKEGKIDVLMMTSKKLKREEYVYYPKTNVWDSSFIFLTNKETKAKYDITSLDDVRKYDLKVGIIRDNAYHELFWDIFPWQDPERKIYHPQLEPVKDIKLNLRKLDNNRINLYPVVKTIGLYTVKKMGLKNIVPYDFILFSKPYPNVFSKASTFKSEKYPDIVALMDAYDKELAEFKATPEFKAIFDKYEK